jgi:hypothetical protein
VIVEADTWLEACDSYTGFCTACADFTTGCVEPDAEDYECEGCGEHTVMGAEQALLLGIVELGRLSNGAR